MTLLPLILALAHVGSPDIYLDGKAGPYPVFVTVRPPQVIPGVAEVEVRTAEDVTAVYITPTPMTGPGAEFAPTADQMKRSAGDPRFFTGGLWIMSSGSWQVRMRVVGAKGGGFLNVPVAAAAKRTLGMDRALAALLFVLMLVLAAGFVAIIQAAARDAQRPLGLKVEGADRRRGWIGLAVGLSLAFLALYGGRAWWNSEARDYDGYLYKPLGLAAALEGGKLELALEHRGWFQDKDLDDLALDHGYPMHLFVVAWPAMERVWHLHPSPQGSGRFEHALPAMPAGKYRLYADIVHRTGFPETLVTEIDLPAIAGAPPQADDTASGPLAPGWRMVRVGNDRLKAKDALRLGFELVDANGRPADDLETYLGMPGHAAVLSQDGTVFAHLHPTGTVPMAAMALAAKDPHAGHYMGGRLPPIVYFPYGFPKAGAYRLFVQMKRAGRVETGVFDLRVEQ